MKLTKLEGELSLTSTGKKGAPYTDAEKATAKAVALAVLIAAETAPVERESEVPQDVIEAFTAVEETEEYKDVPDLMRRVYRHIESSHFDEEGNSDDSENWPKVRDWTSVGLMFRKALLSLNIEEVTKNIDKMFKKYVPKKKTA